MSEIADGNRSLRPRAISTKTARGRSSRSKNATSRSNPTKEAKEAETTKAALKNFVGKRAVGRLGCYACHDIPGFDSARPIGVALNDWGKKDANKLAFEDIANFFKKQLLRRRKVDR